jgi:hypothetical protein
MILILVLLCIIYILYNIVYRERDGSLKTDEIIQVLVRSCARWAVASLQDTSPLIATLHANYSAGYLWALQDSFTDKQIINATGIDIIKFQKRITEIQDVATRRLIKVCPAYAIDLDKYLARVGGES